MVQLNWPSEYDLYGIQKIVAKMSGKNIKEVSVVVSPYRICPLGAHIDHQGGNVTAMTINKGILLGFVPSGDPQVIVQSGQFKGEVRFRVDEAQCPRYRANLIKKSCTDDSFESEEESEWGNYARGALYALQKKGNLIVEGIVGFISGSEGFDSSGLSSSAAVGIAYLLALESANNIMASPVENIQYDRVIENEYLGLRNGILDQSAILLSSRGCLTFMNCKTRDYKIVHPQWSKLNQEANTSQPYSILLAFSGLKHALICQSEYNERVRECRDAASILLKASGSDDLEPILSNVRQEAYEAHQHMLKPNLTRRAEHYFSEVERVSRGIEAWESGDYILFGELISASGLSSINNYECGAEPLIQLHQIMLRAPGVYGARFSGAGFRGCCLAFVDPELAAEAASFVRVEYQKVQPELAAHLNPEDAVLICSAGDCAHIV